MAIRSPPDAYEIQDGYRRYAVVRHGVGEGLSRDSAARLLERALSRDSFVRGRLAHWYREDGYHPGDDAQVASALLREVASGWIRVIDLGLDPLYRSPSGTPRKHTRPDPIPSEPTPIPEPEPDEQPERYLRRLQLGNLCYRPHGIVLLPNLSVARSPWAALIAAARHMAANPGDIPVLCFHQAGDEVGRTSELRAKAFHALIRDDRDAWVALQAEHGSIEDTQLFLLYLANVKSWPLAIDVTRQADKQTKAAVLAFQRFYNMAFRESIYEDGIVGRQTLAAIFSVIKVEIVRWFELNDADYAQLYYLPQSAYLGCESRYAGIPQFSIGFPRGSKRAVDVLFIPSGQSFSPEASPPGSGLYVEDGRFHEIPIDKVRAPQSHLLVIRLVEPAGQPIANVDYELVVEGDRRMGTTDAVGEIVEANVPEGIPLVKLSDGRVVVFHDRYRKSLAQEPTPRPVFSHIPFDDALGDSGDEDADGLYVDHGVDGD